MQVDTFENELFRGIAKGDIFKGYFATQGLWTSVWCRGLDNFRRLIEDILDTFGASRSAGGDIGQLGEVFHGLE